MQFSPSLWNRSKVHAKKLKDDAGNVLFIILLAVALFAALSYVVAGSTRSGGGDTSRENMVLNYSQIKQYSTSIDVAIQRMRISNGCTPEQISFENPIDSGYTNPNAPSDKRCHVFDTAGGNVPFQKVPLGVSIVPPHNGSLYYFGNTCIPNVGTGGTNCHTANGTDDDEIVMFIYGGLTDDMCSYINKIEGVSAVEVDAGCPTIGEKYQGSFSPGGGIYSINPVATQGKFSGCFKAMCMSNTNVYYHVVLPR